MRLYKKPGFSRVGFFINKYNSRNNFNTAVTLTFSFYLINPRISPIRGEILFITAFIYI